MKGELIGIAFDTAATGIALSQVLSPWIPRGVDADLLPAVFTVRGPSQQGRRRELALLEYGCILMARERELDPLVHSIGELIADMASTRLNSTVQLPLRVFVHRDRAVLVAVESPALVGDRRLERLAIVELPCWRATVDPSTVEVIWGDQAWSLGGVITTGNDADTSRLCRELWMMSVGNREAWAPALHDLATNSRVINASGTNFRNALQRLLVDLD